MAKFKTGAAVDFSFFLFLSENKELAEDIVAEEHEHGLYEPRHIHVYAQHRAEQLRDRPVHPKRCETRSDKSASLGEDVRVLALKDPFAVRGVSKGDARHPVDYCKGSVLREGRVQRPTEKQEVEAEARGGGDKRREAADYEIHQKLAVLEAKRLYLFDHLICPPCRRYGK